MTVVTHLPHDPLAIIGDVHGERESLHNLLRALGYGKAVNALQRGATLQPHQRGEAFLVFVGDLVDRGPDSPGVVEDVLALVDAGWAICVLGNHELNLIKDNVNNKRPGTKWFVGIAETFNLDGDEEHPYDAQLTTPEQRTRFVERLNTFPLVALRKDIRVVHAAWDDDSFEKLKNSGSNTSIKDLVTYWDQKVESSLKSIKVLGEREMAGRGPNLTVENGPNLPQIGELPNWIAHEEREQNEHPIKHLSSGPEIGRSESDVLEYIDGKYRYLDRHPWWNEYTGPLPVVVGHYWRMRKVITSGHSIFKDLDPWEWLGPDGLVFCVDYSAGRRYKDRVGQIHDTRKGLAALLWPALQDTVLTPELLFADGTRQQTTGFAVNR